MRIVSFGCSLSRQGSDNIEYPDHYNTNFAHRDSGVIRTLAKLLDCEYQNYSISSASMEIINDRFNSYMISDYKKDDIIIWQMTYFERLSLSTRIHKDIALDYALKADNIDLSGKTLVSEYYVSNDTWSDEYYTVDLLSHNHKLPRHFHLQNNVIKLKTPFYRFEKNLINSLALQKMINNMGNPLLVWFGWQGALIGKWDWNEEYERRLKKENINYEEKRYLEWCKENNLTLTDTLHPCPFDSAPIYARMVLLPRLKKLLNETSQ